MIELCFRGEKVETTLREYTCGAPPLTPLTPPTATEGRPISAGKPAAPSANAPQPDEKR